MRPHAQQCQYRNHRRRRGGDGPVDRPGEDGGGGNQGSDESDPVTGAPARAGFLRLLKFLLDEAQLAPDEADEFIARGMLINTLMACGRRWTRTPQAISWPSGC